MGSASLCLRVHLLKSWVSIVCLFVETLVISCLPSGRSVIDKSRSRNIPRKGLVTDDERPSGVKGFNRSLSGSLHATIHVRSKLDPS